ncbi:unnamed protein product [Lathyrus oleraceus]
MTSSTYKFYTIFISIFLVLLFISTCGIALEEKFCGRKSKTWRSICFLNMPCTLECNRSEQAIFGVCEHYDCFCFFNCSELSF